MFFRKRELIKPKIDFVGIGAIKSATTWIYECLKEHPQICVSEPKETRFFSREISPFEAKNISSDPRLLSEYEKKSIEEYAKYFKRCKDGQIVGEVDTYYMVDPDVPRKIFKEYPNIKIIASLRNPIERAYSHFLYSKYSLHNDDSLDFEEAFRKYPDYYGGTSLYYQRLKPYFDLFPKENILILLYEEIKKHPLESIQRIFRFLGVRENFIPSSLEKRTNPTVKYVHPASFRVYSFLTRALRRYGFGFFSDFFKKTPINNLLDPIRAKRTIKKEPIDCQTRKRLYRFFEEDIHKLEKLINRDLSFWQ